MGLVAPRHVESSWIRDQTCVFFIGRRNLYHQATRETCQISFKLTLINQWQHQIHTSENQQSGIGSPYKPHFHGWRSANPHILHFWKSANPGSSHFPKLYIRVTLKNFEMVTMWGDGYVNYLIVDDFTIYIYIYIYISIKTSDIHHKYIQFLICQSNLN